MEADTKKIPNTVLCKRIAVFISIFQPTLELLWTKGSAREIPSDRFFLGFFFPCDSLLCGGAYLENRFSNNPPFHGALAAL